jgi:hypothetical protein
MPFRGRNRLLVSIAVRALKLGQLVQLSRLLVEVSVVRLDLLNPRKREIELGSHGLALVAAKEPHAATYRIVRSDVVQFILHSRR